MWDNITALQLLKLMPNELEDEHLDRLEKLLQADKYKNQLLSGSDLCGTYAPFCVNCDKSQKYPCAVAYVKFMQSAGFDVAIASEVASAAEDEAPIAEQSAVEEAAELNAQTEDTAQEETQTDKDEVISDEEETLVETDGEPSEEEVAQADEVQQPAEQPDSDPPQGKLKIRIAIARKRTL